METFVFRKKQLFFFFFALYSAYIDKISNSCGIYHAEIVIISHISTNSHRKLFFFIFSMYKLADTIPLILFVNSRMFFYIGNWHTD